MTFSFLISGHYFSQIAIFIGTPLELHLRSRSKGVLIKYSVLDCFFFLKISA